MKLWLVYDIDFDLVLIKVLNLNQLVKDIKIIVEKNRI
jgi:hypothetical protein